MKANLWTVLIFLVLGSGLSAQQASFPHLADFARWSSADLQAINGKLTARTPVNEASAVIERLGDSGSLRVFMEKRNAGEFEPEAHTEIDDLLVIQEGEVTLLYGGTIEGGKERTTGQIRGGHIVGGKTVNLAPGDVIFLPAGMPHQMTVPPGHSLYLLVAKTPSAKPKDKSSQ